MPFEVFDGGKNGVRAIPSIHCGHTVLKFNASSLAKLGSSENVIFLWDKEGQRAAAQPSDRNSGYHLTRATSGIGQVSARRFLVETGLANAGRLNVIWDQNNGWLEWDIPAHPEDPARPQEHDPTKKENNE